MARYNEILVGRYNRHLQKLLGMKGEPPAPQLSTEITPSVQLFHGMETHPMEGWNRFGIATTQALNAAQNSAFRLRMVNASNVMAVIEYLAIWTSVATEVLVTIVQISNNLATVMSGSRVDSRQIATASTAVPSKANNDASGNALFSMFTEINKSLIILDGGGTGIPLMGFGNDSMEVYTAAVNTSLTVSCIWRERAMEESEKSL